MDTITQGRIDKIGELIKKAMKEKDKKRLEVYRFLKKEFVEYATSEKGGNISDDLEISMISKMVKTRRDMAETYKKNGRFDASEQETFEADVLSEFLPKSVSNDDINEALDVYIEKFTDGNVSISMMRDIIDFMSDYFDGATVDKKFLSTLIREKSNK